jgi:hypothetical protein
MMNMSNCDVQIYTKLHVILNNDGIKDSLVRSKDRLSI